MVNILVIGSVNMDVVTPIGRLPLEGETLRAGEVSFSPGGKGANAAVAAARLRANVRFVGCVGDDAFGATLRSGLEHEGIDCGHLRTVPDCATGTAIILLNSQSGQNSILISAGANQCLTVPEENELFVWADALLLQLEVPLDVCIEAIKRARTHNVMIVFDPAPARNDLPFDSFNDVDIISPNETELAILTGQPIDSEAEVLAACRVLLDRGAKHVVAKLGTRGAASCSADEHCFCDPFSIQAVDSTAAGDSFTASLTIARLRGLEWNESLRYACAAGALTCTRHGAQSSLPTSEELEEFLTIQ